jgi:hypothetical protein
VLERGPANVQRQIERGVRVVDQADDLARQTREIGIAEHDLRARKLLFEVAA